MAEGVVQKPPAYSPRLRGASPDSLSSIARQSPQIASASIIGWEVALSHFASPGDYGAVVECLEFSDRARVIFLMEIGAVSLSNDFKTALLRGWISSLGGSIASAKELLEILDERMRDFPILRWSGMLAIRVCKDEDVVEVAFKSLSERTGFYLSTNAFEYEALPRDSDRVHSRIFELDQGASVSIFSANPDLLKKTSSLLEDGPGALESLAKLMDKLDPESSVSGVWLRRRC